MHGVLLSMHLWRCPRRRQQEAPAAVPARTPCRVVVGRRRRRWRRRRMLQAAPEAGGSRQGEGEDDAREGRRRSSRQAESLASHSPVAELLQFLLLPWPRAAETSALAARSPFCTPAAGC